MESSNTQIPPLVADTAWNEQLERLYRRYHTAIRRYIVRTFGGGPPDPDDVVQVAFEKYVLLKDSQSIDNPGAFLVRSARNYVIDQRRRMSVRLAHANEVQATNDDTDDLDAQRVLEARERWQAVETAIKGLDARSRRMLIWNRIHGMSCAEIARRQRCSPTLVKALIARALLACQHAVRSAEGDNP